MHLDSHFLIREKVLVIQKRANYGKPHIIKKQILLQKIMTFCCNWIQVYRVGIRMPNSFIDFFFLLSFIPQFPQLINIKISNSPNSCEHEGNNEKQYRKLCKQLQILKYIK